MSELSGLFTTGGATGDQQAGYTQAQLANARKIVAACSKFEGVAPGYLNELACTANGANTVAVNTGGAMVDGLWYYNDASQDVNVPSAVGGSNTRIDRFVLRASWASFTVRVHRIAGVDAAEPEAPAITQTSGTTYDIPLCQVLVDTSGAVTVTDERVWAAPHVDDSTLEVAPTAGHLRVKDGGITAAKIANRTRTFFVPPLGAETVVSSGFPLIDNAKRHGYGFFHVPSDFVSGMSVKAIVLPSGTGNMRWDQAAAYGASGEAYNTHTATVNPTTTAVTINQRLALSSMALSSAAAGDYVRLDFQREGDAPSDTVVATVFLVGWLVEYTADS